MAKPSHMSRRSGGEPCEPASFFARLSTRVRPRIFLNVVPLPACAAQDELVSSIFVDHPLDQMRARNSPFFLFVITTLARRSHCNQLPRGRGTHIAFAREGFYQLLTSGFLLALLALIHSILLFPPSCRPRPFLSQSGMLSST